MKNSVAYKKKKRVLGHVEQVGPQGTRISIHIFDYEGHRQVRTNSGCNFRMAYL